MPDRIPFFKPAPLGKTGAEAERAKFYNSAAWRRLRALYLARHPLCVECEGKGLLVEATVVHHVQERLQRPDLALSLSNLAGLCPSCHTRHHARQRAKGDRS